VTLLEDRIQREIDVEQMEKADEEQKLQNLLQETELARKAQAVALKKALHEKRQGQKQMKKLGAMTNRPHLPALST
jgi:isocitrate lyase